MLKSFRIHGFKSLMLDSPLRMSEISIFCGANSSGKSSVIQSILMLSQSLSSRYRASVVSLNGGNVRLGSLHDITNHSMKSGTIATSFIVEPPKSVSPLFRHSSIECEFTFGSTDSKTGNDDVYHPSVLEFRLTFRRNTPDGELVETISATRDPEDIATVQDGGLVSNFLINELTLSEIDRLFRDYPDVKILSCEGNGFLPTAFKIEYNHSKKVAETTITHLLGRASKIARANDEEDLVIPGKLLVELKSMIQDEASLLSSVDNIPDGIEKALRDIAKKAKSSIAEEWKKLASNIALPATTIPDGLALRKIVTITEWDQYVASLDHFSKGRLMNIIEKRRPDLEKRLYSIIKSEKRSTKVVSNTLAHSLNALTSYFSRSIKYLGPLRNEPQPVYSSVGHADPTSVGLKGEYAVAALHINKERVILYPAPPKSTDSGKLPAPALQRATLQVACTEWLSHLGIVTEFVTRDKGKLGYSIDVKTAGDDSWHDLTHVGVGVSQVIPIVVMLLLSASGDLLVFEQPELHLHPLVQSRLTDMYWAMSNHGRQCMIETHSEYIINRIRLRIAQSSPSDPSNNPLIYFITKESGASNFEEVKVNRYGSIQNWPVDFFDQNDRETERILIEGALKRKLERDSHR